MKRWVVALLGTAAIVVGGFALVTAVARAGAESGKSSDKRFVKEIEHKVIAGPGTGEGSYLGVRLENPEGEDARGAVVRGVEDDSPAEKAGIQKGDTIVRFDGEAVRSAAQLARLVRETPPGRSVKVDVRRDGASRTLTALTGEAGGLWIERGDENVFHPDTDFDITVPEPFPPHQPGGTPFVGPGPHVFRWKGPGDGSFALPWTNHAPMRLGVRYMELGDQLATYFGVDADHGVLVTSVEPDSPAAKAGLQAGDVILEFDGKPIEHGADLREHVADAEGGGALSVKVQRHGKPLDLKVTLAERELPRHREAEVSL